MAARRSDNEDNTTGAPLGLSRTPSDALKELMRHHPLQRLSSPSRELSLAVHALGLSSFAYSFWYLTAHPNHINRAYGWHFQYLTIIGLLLATLTFSFGVFADVTLSRRLFQAKNLLSMTSAPMSVLISLLYWGLRAIDPELVVPKELELPLPPDLSFHLAPAAFLVVDLLLFSPPWTITVGPAFGLSAVIAFGYWFWIEHCFRQNGFYPYPIFELVGTAGRVGLFGGSAALMAVNTSALSWVYRMVNRAGEERVGELKKQQ
ncbi:uncharacterized protein HMPREF1541_06492 [Cyphellophora europaea CBS 101466]|uniref:FAR-17a/AIG1-like protein n=1 Tax=Cyphellophora europaea (strain CBS 101466) TaxID=1220924 RepID=W2RPS0_CYPE1|nr:uncharacterized protein HMPREF1541_06492 [Cyphellophora europaea CBS 101466]ETN38457.1 hypothetical protein HMPREF1541_06492 [Cyphellophora europaea CBS 101466]